MIQQLIFSSILFVLLFILSRKVISYFYLTVFVITRSRNASLVILAAFLLPGTIIHELSHFLFALILHIPTGKLSIFPGIEKSGEVHAGKLTLGESDPFRLALIGLAPSVIGIVLLYFLSSFFFPLSFLPTTHNPQPTTIFSSPALLLAICYLLLAISVTMFSSKKDMQPLKIALPIAALVMLGLYYIGIRMLFTADLVTWIDQIIKNLNYSLLLTAILNTIFFACIFLIFVGLQKILKRKIEVVRKT